jgi:hypothetical protein
MSYFNYEYTNDCRASRHSVCIFQVVASLPTKACIYTISFIFHFPYDFAILGTYTWYNELQMHFVDGDLPIHLTIGITY